MSDFASRPRHVWTTGWHNTSRRCHLHDLVGVIGNIGWWVDGDTLRLGRMRKGGEG